MADTTTPDAVRQAAALLGRKGGSAKSPAKTAAARANAKLPRPRARKKAEPAL